VQKELARRVNGEGSRGGYQIHEWLVKFCTAVPETLTASKIELVLSTATLGAGGGPKGAKNVWRAIDDLIRECGFQVYEPPDPNSE
jgi:hypothetical protein